jgi:OmpA-OmpF porin, OOP family
MKIVQWLGVMAAFWLAMSETQAQGLQNMVKNPSFEQYKNLPEDLGEIRQASFHGGGNQAGGDYFHRRTKNKDVNVPRNKMGRAEPRTGDAYAGFYAYTNRYVKREFREYIQLQLKQPLQKDHEYCVRAHVYLSESSNRGIAGLGLATSRYAMAKDNQTVLELPYVWLLRQDKKPLLDRKWVEISTIYKAQGGETHIIIGNFQWDKDTKVTGAIEVDSFRNPNVDFAYYFLDDVCVTDLKFNFSCDCGNYDYIASRQYETIVIDAKIVPKTYALNSPTVLENVRFERDKATILPASHTNLDELVLIMKKNPTYVLEISGHTSDKGDPRDNHFLSQRRAKAVCDYLIASGIDDKRLTYRGYGQARPIALNNNAENRAKNERIQVLLTNK